MTPTPNAAKTVLMVEDLPASVRVLRKRLGEMGLQVQLVRTLNRAIELIGAARPDLVIIDLYLPDDWGRLEKYRDCVPQNEFNQGELLGAALDEKRIPYFYYTSELSFYGGKEKGRVMAKAEPVDKVIAKVKSLLGA